ncbi:MAG: hypothetical protein M0Q91_08805 [Methanoregula sp.]|jgi:hypothetical protein|nr:hypothetical protein [Methanoregula sp.]
MASIDPNLKISLDRYIRRHRKYEFIDCAVFSGLESYSYIDNEVDLFTNPPHKHFATDLVYIANDKTAILLIEETENPSNKKGQLINYAKLSAESAKSITKTDATPNIDVMLVIPESLRGDALKIYDEVNQELGNLGQKWRGISIWYYDQNFKALRLCGGTLSPAFPKDIKVLHSRHYGTFKILKTAPPIFLIEFIVLKALEAEYGKTQSGIEINKEKLTKWLGPYGIINQEKWVAALKIGQDLGIISNFSAQQITGTLNYSKSHPASIGKLRAIVANPFDTEIVGDDTDGNGQKSLSEFYRIGEEDTIESDDE